MARHISRRYSVSGQVLAVISLATHSAALTILSRISFAFYNFHHKQCLLQTPGRNNPEEDSQPLPGIVHLLLKLLVHYRVHNRPPLSRVVCQLNPIHTITTYPPYVSVKFSSLEILRSKCCSLCVFHLPRSFGLVLDEHQDYKRWDVELQATLL
jgi:hypothetical protein